MWRFSGGIRLSPHKALSSESASLPVALPAHLVLPLEQHIGVAATAIVKPGDMVLKGQPLAVARAPMTMSLHAPTSGRISALAEHPVPHPEGGRALSLVLEPDGDDRWGARSPLKERSASAINRHLQETGVIGLGGAGFPTHIKLSEALQNQIEILVINGVECEPYITCDDRLIRERANEVVAGARLLQQAVAAPRCIIAVEADMPAAYQALMTAGGADLELVVVPAIYPAGGEKQLIKVLTGLDVPSGALPVDIGVLMFNVATAAAAYRAIVLGEPLIERYVTVTGEVANPGNRRVLIGTPIADLLEDAADPERQVILGGPMMGVWLSDYCVPITKTCNCVLVCSTPRTEFKVMPCIHCGDCVPVCPVGLQPQALYEAANTEDFDSAQDLRLFDCIECGCCAYVCPSRLPLVHYYRQAKSAIDGLDLKTAFAEASRRRYLWHQQRVQHAPEFAQLTARHLSSEESLSRQEMREEIAAAVARARSKRARRDNDQGGEDP
jgi:electron transport complex protein RnfC